MNKYFKIVKDSSKSLREKSKEITEITPEIVSLLNKMHDYLVLSQDDAAAKKLKIRAGVGLAAPQIGQNIKALAIYYDESTDEETKIIDHRLVNPRIILESVQEVYLAGGEGCLSVDEEHQGYVYRHNKIQVKAFNVQTMKEEIITARGYEAIVLQHEIDHLNGILFYDHINKNDPFMIKENAIRL